jgi:hypothetical protein
MFNFYDLRIEPLEILPDGTSVDFNVLIRLVKTKYPHFFNEHISVISGDIDFNSVDPRLCEKKEWKVLFNTIVFIISGHITSIEDMRNIQKTFFELKSYFMKNNKETSILLESRDFVFGSLPYLFCGFNFNKFGYNKDGINSFGSALMVLEHFIYSKEIKISTLLCAHRESKAVNDCSLMINVDKIGCRKMVNLVLGIKNNIPKIGSKLVRWNFYHTVGSAYSTISVFPNIIFKYLSNLDFPKLITTLNTHYNDFINYLDEFSKNNNIVFQVNPVDHLYMSAIHGIDKETETKIKYISTNSTLKEMKRLMPYYDEVKIISDKIIEQNLKKSIEIDSTWKTFGIIKEAVDYYKKYSNLNIKSLLETRFYYEFGKICMTEKSIVLGFERDHDLFQSKSIALGYDHDLDVTTDNFLSPVLYSRWNRPELDVGNFKTLSFRQFWRPSDRINTIQDIESIRRVEKSKDKFI